MGTAEPVHARYNVPRQARGEMCYLAFSFNGTNIWGKVGLVLRHLRKPEVAKTEVLFTATRWDSVMHVRIGEKSIIEAAWLRVGELLIASSRTTDGDAGTDVSDERMINILRALASGASPLLGFLFAGDQVECSIEIANPLSESEARDLRQQVKLWEANRAVLMN